MCGLVRGPLRALVPTLVLVLLTFGGPREARAVCGTPPVFVFAIAWAEPVSGTNTLFVDAALDDPDGSVPSTITSVKVTGPTSQVFTLLYNFPDLSTTGLPAVGEYSLNTGSTTIPTGTYTFEATDTTGCVTTFNTTLASFPTLGAVTITSPTAEQLLTTTTPTFTWSAVTNAGSYRVRIEDAPSFRTRGNVLYTSQKITTTSFTVPKGVLTPGRRYALRIEAQDTGLTTTGQVFNTRSVGIRNFSVEGPRIGAAVNKTILTSTDTLTVTVRLLNRATTAVAADLIIWVALPGSSPITLAEVSLTLPANLNTGSFTLLSIPVAGLPTGNWAAGARFIDPATGVTMAERTLGWAIQ